LVDRDPEALAEAEQVFARLGHRFEAALVGAELADLLLARGDTGGATTRFEQALACFDDVGAAPEADRIRSRLARIAPGGTRRPAPRRAVSGWEALTPTELLVVEEVCGGRSNPQVAERLGISRRTVDAHLRSVYTKLGVRTRLALAVARHERDPNQA
jgi:DNA-binding CsgD family transcriptional regulator